MLTAAARYACDLDRVPDDQAIPGQLDPTPILREWSNTNHSTCGISRARLSRRDDRIEVQIVAADLLGGPHDWGSVTVDQVYTEGPASNRACAYTATFDLGHAHTHLHANASHGLAVIAAFTTFTDGSGRLPYLSREFYQPGTGAAPREPAAARPAPPVGAGAGLVAARGDDRLPMLRADVDPAPLLWRWRTTDAATRGISELQCDLRDGELIVRAVAVGPQGPIDWGEAVATVYNDISSTGGGRAAADPVTDGRPTPLYADISVTDSGPAFAVTFDHGFQRVHLHARIYLGVLVVPIFTEFTDGSGRANYFRREVFIRDG
jgi:hypothetical protein